MKLILEGSKKKILKLRKELKNKLRRNDIVTKEVLPEEEVDEKPIKKTIRKKSK